MAFNVNIFFLCLMSVRVDGGDGNKGIGSGWIRTPTLTHTHTALARLERIFRAQSCCTLCFPPPPCARGPFQHGPECRCQAAFGWQLDTRWQHTGFSFLWAHHSGTSDCNLTLASQTRPFSRESHSPRPTQQTNNQRTQHPTPSPLGRLLLQREIGWLVYDQALSMRLYAKTACGQRKGERQSERAKRSITGMRGELPPYFLST